MNHIIILFWIFTFLICFFNSFLSGLLSIKTHQKKFRWIYLLFISFTIISFLRLLANYYSVNIYFTSEIPLAVFLLISFFKIITAFILFFMFHSILQLKIKTIKALLFFLLLIINFALYTILLLSYSNSDNKLIFLILTQPINFSYHDILNSMNTMLFIESLSGIILLFTVFCYCPYLYFKHKDKIENQFLKQFLQFLSLSFILFILPIIIESFIIKSFSSGISLGLAFIFVLGVGSLILMLKNFILHKDIISKEINVDIYPLTQREKEVSLLLLQGFSNQDISSKLGISVYTVKNHLQNIYEKLNIKNRNELYFLLQNKSK